MKQGLVWSGGPSLLGTAENMHDDTYASCVSVRQKQATGYARLLCKHTGKRKPQGCVSSRFAVEGNHRDVYHPGFTCKTKRIRQGTTAVSTAATAALLCATKWVSVPHAVDTPLARSCLQ